MKGDRRKKKTKGEGEKREKKKNQIKEKVPIKYQAGGTMQNWVVCKAQKVKGELKNARPRGGGGRGEDCLMEKNFGVLWG